MKELIGIAVLIAGLFGGTLMADRILQETRKAAPPLKKVTQNVSYFFIDHSRDLERKLECN